MKEAYFESITLIERLYRLFLNVVNVELDRLDAKDINNVQALILYNIGKEQITVGELTQRGYYLGSNVSYNLRKMLINLYVVQVPSNHDKRSIYIKSSEKGLDLYQKLDEVFLNQAQNLFREVLEEVDLELFSSTLRKIEMFWKNSLIK